MKLIMPLACWVCLVFFQLKTVFAVDDKYGNSELRDTILMIEDDGLKVMLIGNDMTKMVNYRRADSLVMMLNADLEKAKSQGTYPEGSRKTHYLVHPEGRRRIKAQSEDFPEAEFDLEAEKHSMNLDLPPYTFIIYDLRNNYQLHIFLNNPDRLKEVSKLNLNEALTTLSSEKKTVKKNFRVGLNREHEIWSLTSKGNKNYKRKSIEIGIIGGVTLIGNRLSPVVSVWPTLQFGDKYGNPYMKLGFVWSQYALEATGFETFNQFYLYNSYDVLAFFKIRDGSKEVPDYWLGLSGGFYTAQSSYDPLNRAGKFGVWMTVGHFVFNWDYIISDYYRMAFTTRIGF